MSSQHGAYQDDSYCRYCISIEIEAESCDMPFGICIRCGVIFGVTGGVTEAVIRRLVPGHESNAGEHCRVWCAW